MLSGRRVARNAAQGSAGQVRLGDRKCPLTWTFSVGPNGIRTRATALKDWRGVFQRCGLKPFLGRGLQFLT